MKKRLTTILLILIFLAGLALLLYPTVSDYYHSRRQAQAIADYSQHIAQQAEAENQRQLDAARAYNAALLERSDPFHLSDAMREEYRNQLSSSKTGVMAYLEIPVIGVTLPIGYGTEEDVLRESVGHLEWSSLPIGGGSTHCVLSGHRGLPSSELFTNLDHMKIGDRFSLHVLDQTLVYEVDNIAVVEPDDHSLLGITPGEDQVTLITCTPYGINSHRLLVRGSRTESESVENTAVSRSDYESHNINAAAIISVILAAAVILLLLFRTVRTGGKRRRHIGKREKE